MPARVIIRKYTGKDGSFGTLVSSLGIKRTDLCVPAVYSSEQLGGKVIPADDASEAKLYCIYRSDDPDCPAYSMECVFKLHLIEAPDVQLSNIRIYPVGDKPRGEHPVRLNIGNSVSYSKPTNTKSQIAVNNIWDYSKDHPFYLTICGLYGQAPDPALGKTEYSVEFKDCGHGNLVYLDGTRQMVVPVATRSDINADITITFRNHTFMRATHPNWKFLDFVDPRSGEVIPADFTELVQTEEGPLLKLIVKNDRWNLMELYPDGLIYKIPAMQDNNYDGTGYRVVWVNMYGNEPGFGHPHYVPNRWFKQEHDGAMHVTETPIQMPYDKPVEVYDVEVKKDPTGHIAYYINGCRKPQLTFDVRCKYHFYNKSGSQFPLRFIGCGHSPMANNVDDVIVDGVVVLNGGTDNEEIMINPELVMKSGHCINGYQCVCEPGLGNIVFNKPLFLCGAYNMNRIGGGVYNPQSAGETDYVYLQIEVPADADPGYTVPQLMIEYDEN